MLLFVYYSIALNNTDISTSGKNKAPISTNNIEAYNKETLNDKICKLTTTNIQLMIDKIEIEKAKVNLEANKIQLFGEKNSLIVKRKELQAEIAILNISNISTRRYQNPLLKPT